MSFHLDTICQLMGGRPSAHSRWFESAISQAERVNRLWVANFLATLTHNSFFFDNGTDLLALLVRRLSLQSPEVNQMLFEGGMGEWGGTSAQIERAFVVTMVGQFKQDPQGSLGYALDAIRSPFTTLQAGNSLAQQSLFFVRVMSQRGEVLPQDVERMVVELFSEPRFQRASALQFLADSESGQFGSLEETLVATLRDTAKGDLDL